MIKRLINLFRKPKPLTEKNSVKQISADEVRKYVRTNFITPARRRGDKRVTVSAEQIHKGMGLNSRYPLVCSAIDSKKFAEFAKVKLDKRTGTKQNSLVKWNFKIR